MIEYIIGNYLVEKGIISKGQFQTAVRQQNDVKVRLGTIAVSEGLMTQAQADAVNTLQQSIDKRFGDIAIEKEYLSPAQVKSLLKEQGSEYIIFMQTLSDNGVLGIPEFEKAVRQFQHDEGLTTTRIESMKSDSISSIVETFFPDDMPEFLRHASIGIRMMTRLVDHNLYIGRGYVTDLSAISHGIFQNLTGPSSYANGFIEVSDGIPALAMGFAGNQYEDNDEFNIDAAGELLNCINGMFATTMSREGTEYEISPQECIKKISGSSDITGRKVVHIPIFIKESSAEFVFIA